MDRLEHHFRPDIALKTTGMLDALSFLSCLDAAFSSGLLPGLSSWLAFLLSPLGVLLSSGETSPVKTALANNDFRGWVGVKNLSILFRYGFSTALLLNLGLGILAILFSGGLSTFSSLICSFYPSFFSFSFASAFSLVGVRFLNALQ